MACSSYASWGVERGAVTFTRKFLMRWGIKYNQMQTLFFRKIIYSLQEFGRGALFSQGNRVKDLSKSDQPELPSMHHQPESRLAQSRAHFREHLEDLAQHCLKLLFCKMHFNSKETK